MAVNVRGHLHGLALIGRSFPSADFEDLYQASLNTRRSRRGHGGAWDAALGRRVAWRGSGEPVVLPLRLPR